MMERTLLAVLLLIMSLAHLTVTGELPWEVELRPSDQDLADHINHLTSSGPAGLASNKRSSSKRQFLLDLSSVTPQSAGKVSTEPGKQQPVAMFRNTTEAPSDEYTPRYISSGRREGDLTRSDRTVGASGRTLPQGLITVGNPYETWSSYSQRVESDRDSRLRRHKRSSEIHSRQKRFISFPTGSIFYVIPKIFIPTYRTTQLFQFFFAQYTSGWILPTSMTVGRSSVDLSMLYSATEDTVSRFGVDGRACLLRAICEAASYPMDNEGLFGEIMAIVLSASKGSNEHGNLDPYLSAEYQGRALGNCHAIYSECPVSMFNLM